MHIITIIIFGDLVLEMGAQWSHLIGSSIFMGARVLFNKRIWLLLLLINVCYILYYKNFINGVHKNWMRNLYLGIEYITHVEFTRIS